MSEKASREELKRVIEGVLNIAPTLGPSGVQAAIFNYVGFHSLQEIGDIMDEIRGEGIYAKKEG